MTRINANIPPKKLLDQHLLAEYREIIRVPNHVKTKDVNVILKKSHNNFTLGKGHVTFFYNKIEFLHKRFNDLVNELNLRGYSLSITDSVFDNIPKELYNDYTFTESDNLLIIGRILERAKVMEKLTINKVHISYSEYEQLIY